MPTILQNERAKILKKYGISKYKAYKIKKKRHFYQKINAQHDFDKMTLAHSEVILRVKKGSNKGLSFFPEDIILPPNLVL